MVAKSRKTRILISSSHHAVRPFILTTWGQYMSIDVQNVLTRIPWELHHMSSSLECRNLLTLGIDLVAKHVFADLHSLHRLMLLAVRFSLRAQLRLTSVLRFCGRIASLDVDRYCSDEADGAGNNGCEDL